MARCAYRESVTSNTCASVTKAAALLLARPVSHRTLLRSEMISASMSSRSAIARRVCPIRSPKFAAADTTGMPVT